MKQRDYFASFQNYSQLRNIIILLSFFASLSHHFKSNELRFGYIDIFDKEVIVRGEII